MPLPSLRLFCTLALSGVVSEVAPAFEARHGVPVEATFLPTAVLMPRLRSGEAADAAILTADGMAALVGEGRVRADSVLDLARSFVGVAVRQGAPKPDISTPDAFIAALLAARSVGLSRQGASGLFLSALFTRLGIADAIAAKAMVIETGYTAELAASGRAELALQQVSELMVVPGVEIVGRIPAALGGDSVFTGGVVAGADPAAQADAFLRAIASARELIAAKGLEPI